MTFLGKLVAIQYDPMGYTYYVFALINDEAKKIHNTQFISCVRFPNWQHRELQIGDAGYVVLNKVKAGIDTWYDGTNLNYYKYDHDQFMKLISTGETKTEDFVL